jgi:CysZ protein
MYAAAPLVVYLTMLLSLAVVGLFIVDDVYRWVQPESLAQPAGQARWYITAERGLFKGLLAVAAFLIVATGAVLLTLLASTILAGPFSEKLSEVVEQLATGHPPPDETFRLKVLAIDSVRAMTSGLQLLLVFGALYLPLLLLSFVPLIGLVGAAGMFLYGCFFLALNFLDPALDRKRLTLRDKLRWARAVLATHLGFGAVLFGLMLVPVLNLVIPPCFVVAGTLLWIDRERIAPSRPPAAPPVLDSAENGVVDSN